MQNLARSIVIEPGTAEHRSAAPAVPAPSPSSPSLTARAFWIFFALIALLGAGLRMKDTASWRHTGFDELIYRRYVCLMDGGKQRFSTFHQGMALNEHEGTVAGTGAGAMPWLSNAFLKTQEEPGAMCELPPTRFLYIYTSWVWKNLEFGAQPPWPQSQIMAEKHRMVRAQQAHQPIDPDYTKDSSHADPPLAALNHVACAFSMLLMIAGGLFAWRMLGRGAGLGVLALMAFDPLQIHLSQHAMVDGFFAFWALMCLWTTWECLRAPKSMAWLAAHGVCLALMVMTKENAFFVYCGLGAVVAANRWLKIGTVSRTFLLVSVAGPLMAVCALAWMAGGFDNFIAIYRSLVSKAKDLEYAKLTGDGPWYRYLLDLLTMSPIVLCLALGALFALAPRRKELAWLAVFVFVTYAVMCNVPNGMNLRYGSIWGLPLRVAAVLMIWECCTRFRGRQWMVATMLVAGLCTYEWRQYVRIAGNPERPFYEVIPSEMLRQVDIIKDEAQVKGAAAAEAGKSAQAR